MCIQAVNTFIMLYAPTDVSLLFEQISNYCKVAYPGVFLRSHGFTCQTYTKYSYTSL